MNQVAKIEDHKSRSILEAMAQRYSMEAGPFEATLRATVVPKECSREQFAAFLVVANEYGLNPITKEIYAFPSKGGIQPIVGIDGWMNLMNSHPEMDGLEFTDVMDSGTLIAIKCKVYRKDRKHPTEVIEYMGECMKKTEPWQKWPARMLRHKAAIQAARYAFGFAGIVEPDEYDRMETQAPMRDVTPPPPPPPPEIETVEAKPEQPITETMEPEPDIPANMDDFISDLEFRLKEAGPDIAKEIWKLEIVPKYNQGAILQPDYDSLNLLYLDAIDVTMAG